MKEETIYCVICKKPVPEDRVMLKAVTCSTAHTTQLANLRRRKRDTKKCRYCQQPSTLEERKLFKLWRDSIRVETRGRKKKPKDPAPPAGESREEFERDRMGQPV
jgi:predicted nucleic acid-binding Zn ribbon protein